jgi:hypothetical protein
VDTNIIAPSESDTQAVFGPLHPKIARNLLSRDLDMFSKIGVSLEYLATAKVIRVDHHEAKEFGFSGVSNLSGVFYPYFSIHDGHRVTGRLRLDHPPLEGGKVKSKYLSPWSDRKHLYVFRGSLELVFDPTIRVVFVEGEKKALAMAAWADRVGKKILPVGLGGVWGWRGRVGKAETPDGSGADEKGPIPDLLAIATAGRIVHVLFDSDVADDKNVQAAERALVATLQKLRTDVRVLRLPVEGANIAGR